MLLTNRINAINAQIAAYLEQIAELQTRVTDLQGHAQEVQGVEQAAESALNQLEAAINMLQLVCPEEIATFKAAIDAKFAPLPQLAGSKDEAEAQAPTTIDEPPVTVIDTPAVSVVESIEGESAPEEAAGASTVDEIVPTSDDNLKETTEESDTSNGHNGNGSNGYHHALTYDELSICDAATLIKLCALKGIPVKNSKAKSAKAVKDMAALLGGIVSLGDLDAVNNS